MLTSVHGSCSLRHRDLAGFTLVEILLVVLIIAILSSVAIPTLSIRTGSVRDEAERLAQLIEHAEIMAGSTGSTFGLHVSPDRYNILRWSGSWTSVPIEPLFSTYLLPKSIRLELAGNTELTQATVSPIRFPPTGFPPAFRIRVSGANEHWLVESNVAGRVKVSLGEWGRMILRGFTLVEVLVGLAITAIALGAAMRASSSALQGSVNVENRTVARWVSKNELAKLQAQQALPPPGYASGDVLQANIHFHWDAKIETTPNPNFRRIVISTRRQDGSTTLATVEGFSVGTR